MVAVIGAVVALGACGSSRSSSPSTTGATTNATETTSVAAPTTAVPAAGPSVPAVTVDPKATDLCSDLTRITGVFNDVGASSASLSSAMTFVALIYAGIDRVTPRVPAPVRAAWDTDMAVIKAFFKADADAGFDPSKFLAGSAFAAVVAQYSAPATQAAVAQVQAWAVTQCPTLADK
jgi:hypothetical protein